MKNTIYIIGPSSVFNAEFAKFQAGEGHYYEAGFSNWGAIRYSLDGTQVLLEEEESKFLDTHLQRPDVTTYTEEEIKQYLIDNKEDWQEDEEL